MRRVLGLTWVGWLNFCVLQWLGLRLAYEVETQGFHPKYGEVVGWQLKRVRPMKHWNRGWWMVLPSLLSLPAVAAEDVALAVTHHAAGAVFDAAAIAVITGGALAIARRMASK